MYLNLHITLPSNMDIVVHVLSMLKYISNLFHTNYMDKRSLKSKRTKEEYISFLLRILENQDRNKSDKTTKRTFNCQGFAVREMDN